MSRQPRADSGRVALAAGVALLARVLSRSLGPTPRRALAMIGTKSPELIGAGGTLARRITAVDSPRLNTGAMILRTAVEAVNRSHGDGVATTAVLARSMVADATRVVEGGAEPVAVRRGIERGVDAACRALSDHAVPINGAEDLARLAIGATQNRELGELLAELYDLLGERGWLLTEEQPTPGFDREYIDGARWRARPGDRELLPPGMTDLTVADPLIVVVDQAVDSVDDVVPAIDLAAAAGTPLLLVARDFAEPVRQFLRTNRKLPGTRVVVAPVCPAAPSKRRADDLADLAVLSGATVLADALGRSPRKVRRADCGRARRALVRRGDLTVSGGSGDDPSIQQRIAELEGRTANVDRGGSEWRAARARIARLAGTTGVVRFGVASPTEKDPLKGLIAKAQRVLELALAEGTVAGGGVGYLQCVPAVLDLRTTTDDPGERYGLEIVAAAMEAPFRQIVANYAVSGTGAELAPDPSVALARARELGPGWGFDASSGTYVAMTKAGVLDSAGVLAGALRSAGSCAASIVSTSVIVRAR